MPEKGEIIQSKIGSFEVVRKLGGGFSGEVYLAKDLKLKKPIALKLLNPQAFKEGQLDAFKREFKILSDLYHPSLCRVYDFGFAAKQDRYFFTLELVQGTPLYSYTDTLSSEDIEEIFVQIADAIGFIHSADLIHYDIKGDNILVTTAGDRPLAKIVDFGLAITIIETHENIAGTIRYMSPEMITQNQAIDYRADLYSLGIVLYRMLAGRYPEQWETMRDALMWHTRHTSIDRAPLEARGVPEYLIDVVDKLTRRIPTERFSSASVLIKFIELHSGRTYAKSHISPSATLAEECPLVGREGVISKIRYAIENLSEKKKMPDEVQQTLIISGPHGSGKSRIIKEAKYISQLSEIDTAIVKGAAEGASIGSFCQALGIGGASPAQMLDEVLSKGQFCLMADDLDRCSGPVRDFIVGLASSLYTNKFMGEPKGVYLIATLTAEDPKVSLPMSLHLGVEHEHLKAFTLDDVAQYIRLSLGEDNPQESQVNDILKFSGGNPELVRTAVANLASPTSRFAFDAKGFFTDKIMILDDVAKRVIGFIVLSETPLSQGQLIELTEVAVETALSRLIREGYVSCDRARTKFFVASGAIGMAVRDTLSEDEKREIAGKLLSYFRGEGGQSVEALVGYARVAARPEDLVGLLISAAEEMEKRSLGGEAKKHYEEAVAILPDKDTRLPAIHRKLAKEELLKGEYDGAIGHIEKAMKLSETTVDDLKLKSWISRLRHRPQEAREFIREAVKLTGEDNNSPEYLKLLNEEAQCLVQMGKDDEAIAIFDKTREYAQNLSPAEMKKVVNNNLGVALAAKGDFARATEFYQEKYKLFSEDRQLAASILSQLGYVYQEAGLLSEGMDAYKKSREIYSSLEDVHNSLTILNNIVKICQSKGAYTDALGFVKEGVKVASRSASEKELATNFLTLGTLYIHLGLEDVAERYLCEAASLFQKLGDRYMEGWVEIWFAYLYKEMNRHKEALAHLDNVIKTGCNLAMADLVFWGHYGAADVLIDVGDIEAAKGHLSEVDTKSLGTGAVPETIIKVELLRSRLALLQHKDPPAEIEGCLKALTQDAEKLDLRELLAEVLHTQSKYYQKKGDERTSAQCVAKAKGILDGISKTLAEEYRDSFLKKHFRRHIFEDSVKFKGMILDTPSDEETPVFK